MTKENLWKNYTDEQKKVIFDFAEDYKKYLDSAKTEREFVDLTEKELEKNGFVNINEKSELKKGDKIYFNNRNKNIIAVIVGNDIKSGINMIVSHVDSPRLDFKPNPIMEEEEFALLNTHYYGGIKKYQWAATPLALHGVVFLKNGEKVTLSIGEKDDEPVFSMPDILPHLSYNVQDERKARDVIKGEELKLLFGNMPLDDENVNKKTENIVNKINELIKKYDIPASVNHFGSLFTIFFAKEKVKTLEDAMNTNDEFYSIYFDTMLENGVIVPPSKYEAHFVSYIHNDEDVEKLLKGVEKTFQKIAEKLK